MIPTRSLGKTNLTVSRIGLGLAALGRPAYINLGHAGDRGSDYSVEAMEARAHAVLDAAWQAGVRYFDAARSYGCAEQFLGSWLVTRELAASAMTVGSKWGYTYTAGWQVDAEQHEVKEHSLRVLRRQFEESREMLGGHLDLYQIHSATLESGVLENREVLVELARLRKAGWKIGITVSGPRQAEVIERALDVKLDGEPVFDCVQATWNVLETSAGDQLRAAHESGRGVIIKEALANGRLTARNDDPAFATRRRVLEELAARAGASLDALALAAVLAQPWVDVVLSGAATRAQLDSNLRAVEVRWEGEYSERLAGVGERPEEYWGIRSRLPWN